MAIVITGRKRLQAQITGLADYTPDAVRQTLLETAQYIRSQVQAVAPQSDPGSSAAPGSLRRAVSAYLSRRSLAAYVRVGVRSGSRVQPAAQHPEFGAKEKRPRRGRVLVFRVRGKLVFASRSAATPPRRYFRRGTAGREAALARGIRKLGRLMEKFPK